MDNTDLLKKGEGRRDQGPGTRDQGRGKRDEINHRLDRDLINPVIILIISSRFFKIFWLSFSLI